MKKALFWDFDGTLIHPNESFLDAMHTALSKHNFMAVSYTHLIQEINRLKIQCRRQ